jgi:4-hydroxy-tetrahydrodipicolinate synthase
MNRMMWDIYGGKRIQCWLSGEKYLLMRLGVFKTWKNCPLFPLTSACRRNIERTIKQNRKWLLPKQTIDIRLQTSDL